MEEIVSLTFNRLSEISKARCEEDFHLPINKWSIAEWTNALCGEAGEAANIAKKIIRIRDGVAGNKPDQEEASLKFKLGMELADVVIYADLCASSLGYNLGVLILIAFNNKSKQINSDKFI